MSRKILKPLTLFLFVGLITLFVLYRKGLFARNQPSGIGNAAILPADSMIPMVYGGDTLFLHAKRDSGRIMEIIGSSKSLMIVKPESLRASDTVTRENP